MDSVGYFIEGFYNQILLRDFVGKIVPGLVLFLSVAMAFRKRDYLLAEAKTHANALTVALLGGLLWLVVVAGQSIGGWFGIWADPAMCSDSGAGCGADVQRFMVIASVPERLLFDRVVAIKEATGNLALFGLASVPFVALAFVRNYRAPATRSRKVLVARTLRVGGVTVLGALLISGLFGAHADHAWQQRTIVADALSIPRGAVAPAPAAPVAPPVAAAEPADPS